MSGYVVEHVTEVTFMEGRDRDSLKPRKGWLGVGHIEGDRGRREIFGEVMHGDRDYLAFTMRCYEMDEYLDFDHMRAEGLVLDAGSSRNMVIVPGDQIERAMAQLPRPVAHLQVGDVVGLRKNPDHPAWKDRIQGEYGLEFVAKPDFDPIIADGSRITERTVHGDGSVQVRAQNGFWYKADGMQEDARATLIVSQTAIDGTPLVVDTPSRDLSAEGPDRFDRAVSALGEQITVCEAKVQQWNPHNEKMQPRIREGWRVLDSVRNDLDHFGTMGKQLTEFTLDRDDVARRRESFAVYLEQSSAELTTGMEKIGITISTPKAPSAAHTARLAELKSAPSRFDAPAPSEAEVSLA